jgi:hypothetical protein
LINYSLENLKNLEFVPNVDMDMPSEILTQEANEIRSKLIRNKDKNNEFDDEVNN